MGSVWDYVAYMRPRAWFPCFVCSLTGYAISPARPDSWGPVLIDLSWLFVVYGVFLWGGTNALNSAHDRDEGPVNFLPNPPPFPRHLAVYGLVVMLLGVGIAGVKGLNAAALALIAVLLSVYYSVSFPGCGRRGKEIPGMDILINSTGFGLGAVLLGYTATSASWSPDLFWVGCSISVR